MFHPKVPCACCFARVIREEMKISHYYVGCGCPVTPLVCANCRNNHHTKICRWCQRKGVYTPKMNSSHAREIEGIARDWISVQRRLSNVSIPYIMQIRLNWLKYLEFEKIKFYELCGSGKFYYSSIFRITPITFFSSFMQAQMFHITGTQRISIQYDKIMISRKLFRLIKNVTVARMLICNLFGESKNTRFFTGRRNIVKNKNELMSIVLHRLLSNFALLIM
jgi:hypothetical protein